MALEFYDGFDSYPGLSTTGTGLSSTWSTSGSHSFDTGRFSDGQAVRISNLNQGSNMILPLAGDSQYSVGFAVYRDNKVAGSASGESFCSFKTAADAQLIRLLMNDIGQILVKDSTGTTLFISDMLGGEVWHYIEFGVIIHAATGRIRLAIDGDVVLDLSGINTLNSVATSTISRFQFTGNSGSTGWRGYYLDDFYVVSGDYLGLGECRVITIRPDGDDSVTWTRLAGASNASQVNEVLMDNDTSYNSSSTPGDVDLLTFGDMPVTPVVVHALMTTIAARKDDGGTRTMRAVLESNAVGLDGTNFNLNESFARHREIFLLNPDGSVAWTKASIDALKAGYELIV